MPARSQPPPAGARVLVIDDDERLNRLLTEYLARFGFNVRTANTPEAGLETLEADPPDLVILDVMLPGMDGLTVCRQIRRTSRLPIIMLTARGNLTDRVTGLDVGADDYLPKPFEPRELIARIHAVLRRGQPPSRDQVSVGDLTIDFSARCVQLHGEAIELTTAEFELLAVLIRHRGRVVTRDGILMETHDVDWDTYDRSIDVLVSRVRQKLGDDPTRPRFIRTVRGVGYGFMVESRA